MKTGVAETQRKTKQRGHTGEPTVYHYVIDRDEKFVHVLCGLDLPVVNTDIKEDAQSGDGSWVVCPICEFLRDEAIAGNSEWFMPINFSDEECLD